MSLVEVNLRKHELCLLLLTFAYGISGVLFLHSTLHSSSLKKIVGPLNQRGSFFAVNMDTLLFLFNKVCPWNQRGSFLALNMYRRKICSALISEHSYLIYKLQMCHIQTKEFITMTRRAAISQQRLQLWRSLC